MFLLILITTFISTVLIVNGYSEPHEQNELETNLITSGSHAIDWSLKEVISDMTKSLTSYRGKVVLLEFFATWCSPCTDNFLPVLSAVRNHYSSSQLVIVSIDTDPSHDDEAKVEQYINGDVFRDTKSVTDDYQVVNIPSFCIIDKDQIVVVGHAGVVDANYIYEYVDDLLGDDDPINNPSGFWQNNWFWFFIVIIIITTVLVFLYQRRKVILHNKKVEQQKLEAIERRRRKRLR